MEGFDSTNGIGMESEWNRNRKKNKTQNKNEMQKSSEWNRNGIGIAELTEHKTRQNEKAALLLYPGFPT